jgi:hypothetical protein
MRIMLHVDTHAEQFYETAKQLGTLASHVFPEKVQRAGRDATSEPEENLNRHRSQLTGLENVAETARKVSDVLDYIKKQIARQEPWHELHESQRFGEQLKTLIETDIQQRAEQICADLLINLQNYEGQRDQQHISLLLIRQFIRQLVVHYEYLVSQKKEKGHHAQ